MARDTLTRKQTNIMEVVCCGVGSDEFVPVDLNTLLETIPYVTTKESMQFSLRKLILHGYIRIDYEERGDKKRLRKVIYPTEEGKEIFEKMK